jgi:hypothetical protein
VSAAFPPDRRAPGDRRVERSIEVAEAEAAKPLVTRRTNFAGRSQA